MVSRFLLPILLSVSIIASTGCGFHLRGSSQIAAHYNPVYIEQGDLDPSQMALLRATLVKSSATLSDDSSANRLRVKFSKDKPRKVASSNLTDVDLLRLNMRMNFSIKSPDGADLLPPQELLHSAEVELDSANVLSHEGIIKERFEDLQRSLVRTLSYQLTR